MDLSQSPIQTLLLLDNDFLPLLLEYGQASHSDYWILFTLEAEMLLTQTQNYFSNITTSKRDSISISHINSSIHRLLSSLFSTDTLDGYCTGQSVVKILDMNMLEQLKSLLKSGVPSCSVLYSINQIVRRSVNKMIFHDLIDHGPTSSFMGSSAISSSSSLSSSSSSSFHPLWSQIRKAIVKDVKFELLFVLNDSQYREYFVEYLQKYRSTITVVTLVCWTEIRKTLETLYPDGGFSFTIQSPIPSPPKPSISPPKPQHSYSTSNVSNMDGVDIYMQFRKLLQALRDLNRKYRLQTQQTTSSTNSNVPDFMTKRLSRAMSITEKNELDTTEQTFNSTINTTSCLLAISDTIRLEIVTLVSYLQSIRLGDIESLDHDYIVINTQKILKIMHILERETFQQLQIEYGEFVDSSVEFCKLVAHNRVKDMNSLTDEQKRDRFFWEKVKKSGTSFWNDKEAHGATYLWLKDSHRLISKVSIKNETFQDLYLSGLYNVENMTVTTKENSSSRKDRWETAIIKHLGTIEKLDLLDIIESITLKLLMQILMLLLTDRNIILVGRKELTLHKLMNGLPRFVWPFRLDCTHTFYLPSTKSFGNRDLSWIKQKMEDHNLLQKNIELQLQLEAVLEPQVKNDKQSLRKGLCWITCAKTSSLDEIDTLLTNNSNFAKDVLVIDTDACKVIPFHSPSHEAKPRLYQDNYFKMWNSNTYGRLKAIVDMLLKKKIQQSNAISIYTEYNSILETHFSVFWMDIFLYALPQNISYFSSPYHIVCCHVQQFMSDLLDRERHLNSHPPGFYRQRLAFGQDIDDDVVDMDGDVEIWFALDMISRSSSAFIDILYRHGDSVEYFFGIE